jgi:hypothetical protein
MVRHENPPSGMRHTGGRIPAIGRSQRPEGLGGGQPGGADGGQQPGEGADENGGNQAPGPGLGRDDGGPALDVRVDGGGGRAGDDSGDAAGECEQDGLGQELDADLAPGGAQGAAQPDFLASPTS